MTRVFRNVGISALAVLLCIGCNKKEQGQQQSANPQQQPAPAAATPSAETSTNPAAVPTSPAVTPAPTNDNAAAVAPGAAAAAGAGTAREAARNEANNSAAAPVPAPAPVVVPAGARLNVRLDNAISTRTARAGQAFSGRLTTGVSSANGNRVLIPRGSTVSGEVLDSSQAGRIKGAGGLSLRLTSLTVNGRNYSIASSTFSSVAKGRGKRSAIASGGGAALGGIIGGLAGGGKGAAIGILGGGAAGAAGGAYTGIRDVELPAETVVTFRLSRALRLDGRRGAAANDQNTPGSNP